MAPMTILLALMFLSSLVLRVTEAQPTTTTVVTSSTGGIPTSTTNGTSTAPASTTTSTTSTTASNGTQPTCQVVSFELRNSNSSMAKKTVSGDCMPGLSATFAPIGGDSIACTALVGCGVIGASSGVRRRQTSNSTSSHPTINGTAEAIEVSFSAPVLLWQVDFGVFDLGRDTATLELTNLYTNATVNYTSGSARWSAVAVVIETGVEPPVVRSFRVRADSFSAFTLLSVRAKPYTPPPSIVFTTTAGNATTARTNATGAAEPTLDPNADFGQMLAFWMENEALYFWLVIAAIILVLILCIVAIVVCICCCCCGDDEDNEMYSMRDASSAYRDDDWL